MRLSYMILDWRIQNAVYMIGEKVGCSWKKRCMGEADCFHREFISKSTLSVTI